MSVFLHRKRVNGFIKINVELIVIPKTSNQNSTNEGRLRKSLMLLRLTRYYNFFKFVRDETFKKVFFMNLEICSEIYFHHTPRIWHYIKKKLITEWFNSHPNAVFIIWSKASPSDVEEHILGVFCKAFKENSPLSLLQFNGTDISEEMDIFSEKGQDSERIIEAFRITQKELLDKFLIKVISKSIPDFREIKSRFKFQQHNLFNYLKNKERFGLIFIRSVFVYFIHPDKEKVISFINHNYTEYGIMTFGESKSFTNSNSDFKTVEPFVYKKFPPVISLKAR